MVNTAFRMFFITTTLLFVLLFCGIVFLLYLTSKRRTRAQIQHLSDLIEEREHLMNFFSAELHDNINQINHLILIETREVAHYLREGNYNQASEELINLEKIIYKQINEVRYLSHALNRDIVLKNGFKEALMVLQLHINKLGVPKCTLRVPKDIDAAYLPPNISVSIYRIIQEGVQNILKHAQATRFSINISISQGKMELIINDNGIGNTQSIVEGIGINGIKKRVQQLGGTFFIQNNPLGGISLIIKLTRMQEMEHENKVL